MTNLLGIHRSSIEIQREILTAIAAEPRGFTDIVHITKTNGKQMEHYLTRMTKIGLVEEIAGKTARRRNFRITAKGKYCLDAYVSLSRLLTVPTVEKRGSKK